MEPHVSYRPARQQAVIRSKFLTVQVEFFRTQGLKFPRRPARGPRNGEVVLWAELDHSRVLYTLKNPRYAGAFSFGRTRVRKYPDGRVVHERLARDEWISLIPDAHEGYISWDEFEENVKRLRANAQAHGNDRNSGPPREGPALLQGLAICAVCGERMTIRYHVRKGKSVPDYMCQRHGIKNAEPVCQYIPGTYIEKAVGNLLVETVSPVTLEAAVLVQQEIENRTVETDSLKQQEVEHARYEADLARRRYMQVHPDNRIVADTLEAEWNEKLRDLSEAQQRYEQQKKAAHPVLDEQQRARIMSLATDFPRLWNDPRTPDRERKRMARLLIEDVTILKGDKGKDVTMQMRFKGGATRTLNVPSTKPAWMIRETSPDVIKEIDALLDKHTEKKIAELLNERGFVSGEGRAFHPIMVKRLRRAHGLKSRFQRLRDAGMLTREEIASQLGISTYTVKRWKKNGLLCACAYNDKNECLYEKLGDNPPVKTQGRKLSKRRRFPKVGSNRTDEVQYEV